MYCLAWRNIYKQKNESEVFELQKSSFILSEPRLIYVTRDQLPFTLHFLTNELFSSCDFLDFPPVILDVIEVPNSNEIQITYAFRYEVK